MYEFFLPSSIDVAVKNDHYNFDKHMHKLREKRRNREKEEKEKRKQMNTSNSVQYDTNRLFLIQIFSVFSSPGFKHSISRKKKKKKVTLLNSILLHQTSNSIEANLNKRFFLTETCIKEKKSKVTLSNDTCRTSSSFYDRKILRKSKLTDKLTFGSYFNLNDTHTHISTLRCSLNRHSLFLSPYHISTTTDN